MNRKNRVLRIAIPTAILLSAAAAFAAPVAFKDGQTLTAADLNNNFGYLVPVGAVVFFDTTSCPVGWSDFVSAQGRYIVGQPSGGTLGTSVGTALGDGENRAVGMHTHATTDPGHAHGPLATTFITGGGTGMAGVGTGSAFNTATATASATTGITVNAAGLVAGTNAPYVQLRACVKN